MDEDVVGLEGSDVSGTEEVVEVVVVKVVVVVVLGSDTVDELGDEVVIGGSEPLESGVCGLPIDS